jgi:hypothetical protein
MTTATPASSVYEGFDRPTNELISELEGNSYERQFKFHSHGNHHARSSSSTRYPRRNMDSESTQTRDSQQRRSSVQVNRSGGDDSNDGDGNPGGTRASWEPDESVNSCGLCHRRFTAFLRRHHCRYYDTIVVHANSDVGFVGELFVTGVPVPDSPYPRTASF